MDYKTVIEPPYEGLKQNILEKLIQTFMKEEDEIYFTFPVGGFQVLHYFQKLTQERLLLIMGDHGANNLSDFKRYKDVWIAYHESLSVPVNFLAFSYFFIIQGGFNIIMNELDLKFIINVSNFKGPQEKWKELKFVFEECIEPFNISDYGVLLE